MSEELRCTKNYGMFRYKEMNRPVDLKKHKKLLALMEKHGFIKSFPLTVRQVDGKLEIVDGQHRYAIARELNLSVYYVVVDKDVDVAEINSSSVSWNAATYIESYAAAGYKDYILVNEFCKRYHLPIGMSASLLAGTVCCNNVLPKIVDGTYKVKDLIHAERVGHVCDEIYPVYKKAKERTFIDAVCAICRLDDIDLPRLIINAKKYSFMLKTYAERRDTLLMLEQVYNYHRRPPMYPLYIKAVNAMKARSVCVKKELKSQNVLNGKFNPIAVSA